MAFSTRVDNFRSAITTGVQSFGGFGFQPKAVVLWTWAFEFLGTGTHVQVGFGLTTGSAAQWSGSYSAQDANTTTTAKRRWAQKALTGLNNTGGVIRLECDCATLWSDGMNLNWTTMATASQACAYLAVGGADLTNVKVGVFSLSTVTGTQTVVGIGFQPDAVMLFSTSMLASQIGSIVAHGKLSLGAAQSSTKRWGWGLNARDGQTTAANVDAMRTMRADSSLLGLTDTVTADFQVDHTAMLVDGFSMNVIDAPASAYQVAFLALQGGSYDINVFAKSAAAAPVSQSVTVGFSASALMLTTVQAASTAAIIADTALPFGAGDFTRANAFWHCVQDAVVTNANMAFDQAPVIRCESINGVGTVTIGSLTGRVASGFNLTWTTNQPLAYQVGYFACGDALSTFMYRTRERTQLRM